MKWLAIKMLMMLGIGVGILNYAMYLKTGRSPLAEMKWSLPSFSLPSATDIKNAIPDINLPSIDGIGGSSGESITVYKWVDANGVINYSQTKPDESIKADIMLVNPETNVVQADKLAELEPESKPEPKPAPAAQLPDISLLPSPENVQKLMDDAKNIQAQMDERTKLMESTINGVL